MSVEILQQQLQSALVIVSQLQQENEKRKEENQQQTKKIEELEKKNQNQQKQITALEVKADDLQNLRFGDSERFFMLEQNKRHAEKEIEKLKEEVQQLIKKDEEKQQRMEIVEVLRKEAKIEIPREADDAAVQKILGECKFPLLTAKINLNGRWKITDVSTGRIVAACPNVTEMNLSLCHSLTDASLQHLASLRNLKALDLSDCDKIKLHQINNNNNKDDYIL
jgi:hypothetical protein